MKKIAVAAATVVAAMAVVVGSAGGSGGPLAVNSGFTCNVLNEFGAIVQTNNSVAYWYASGATYLMSCDEVPPATDIDGFTFASMTCFCGTDPVPSWFADLPQ